MALQKFYKKEKNKVLQLPRQRFEDVVYVKEELKLLVSQIKKSYMLKNDC